MQEKFYMSKLLPKETLATVAGMDISIPTIYLENYTLPTTDIPISPEKTLKYP